MQVTTTVPRNQGDGGEGQGECVNCTLYAVRCMSVVYAVCGTK
jgi:hypothetical protein